MSEKIASVRIQVGCMFDIFVSFGISKCKFLSRLVLVCLRFVQFSRLSKKSCDQIKNVRVSAACFVPSQREIFQKGSYDENCVWTNLAKLYLAKKLTKRNCCTRESYHRTVTKNRLRRITNIQLHLPYSKNQTIFVHSYIVVYFTPRWKKRKTR